MQEARIPHESSVGLGFVIRYPSYLCAQSECKLFDSHNIRITFSLMQGKAVLVRLNTG